MPDKEKLILCERLIAQSLGTLEDLPHDLANSVANQYYRFVELAGKFLEIQNNEELSVECLKQGLITVLKQECCDPNEAQTVQQLASTLARVEAIPMFMNVLRSVDKNTDPIEYRIICELLLDYVKYEIDDAGKKLLLRRLVERLMKKPDKEIPNLIDMIDV